MTVTILYLQKISDTFLSQYVSVPFKIHTGTASSMFNTHFRHKLPGTTTSVRFGSRLNLLGLFTDDLWASLSVLKHSLIKFSAWNTTSFQTGSRFFSGSCQRSL